MTGRGGGCGSDLGRGSSTAPRAGGGVHPWWWLWLGLHLGLLIAPRFDVFDLVLQRPCVQRLAHLEPRRVLQHQDVIVAALVV